MAFERIEIGDLLLIAEFNTGISAEVLARNGHVMNLAHSAIAAPWAGFGDVELWETFEEKAAIYASRIAGYHPLPDGNKRTAYDVMVEFVERNGRAWEHQGGWEATAEALEGIAAGTLSEREFIAFVEPRIAPPERW